MNHAESLALKVIATLQNSGHVAYFAGGCVRDRLMGRQPLDFDVATSATPPQVLALFPRSQKVGVAFGVVLVRDKNAQVEVATFRSDGSYSDGRHPDSVQFTTAQRDAQRRDFTCNGLFFDPVADSGQGQIHDFVGGQADIAAKKLRAIGDPSARFAEDHLRLLRAVRFAAKLGFEIETETLAALTRLAPEIRRISKERIHDEIEMILTHPSRAAGARLLEQTGLLSHLLPGQWTHPILSSTASPPSPTARAEPRAWKTLASLPEQATFAAALSALSEDLAMRARASPAPAAEQLRAALLLSNDETADTSWLLEHLPRVESWETLDKAALKRMMADPRWPHLAALYQATLSSHLPPAFTERITQLQAEGVAPEPFVSGADLIRLGASPGPAFKDWLAQLYNRQLNNELCTREAALEAARQLVGQS